MMEKIYQLVDCDPAIFRAYDIRGIVDQQLSENVYFTIGYAIADILKQMQRHQVVLAWDGRLTSPAFSQALEQGLRANKIEVVKLGLMPTALMYFGTCCSSIDSGLMVTGSHNPKNYNGLKIVLGGQTLAQAGIAEIFEKVKQLPKGTIFKELAEPSDELDMLTPYLDYIVNDIKLSRPLKVIIDYGHGAGAVAGPQLFERMGCQVIGLYDEVDGNFPAHHPDPTIPENLVALQKALAKHGADVGLAFDGDADRLGVVTHEGEIIWPDRLMMLFARDVLSRKPGATIVYDVKCSKQLKDVIEQAQGNPMMSPTGHSLVKGIMKKQHAELAGEMSGHIFFKDRWFGFDDGLYSACRFLEILSQFSDMNAAMATLPENPVSTAEIKIDISEEKKFNFMEKFKNSVKFDKAELVTIDGIRVEFSDGWGLLRASNTSPCLVSRFEADTIEALLRIQKDFKNQILSIDEDMNVPF